MKLTILCLSLAVLTVVTACSKSSPDNFELTIPLGDCKPVKSSSVILCYDSLDDSRCPFTPGVYCVWQGIGVGHFTFQVDKEKHVLTLATDNFGHWRKDTTVAGHTIELLDLKPYPTHTAPQPGEQKMALVRVTKR